MSITNKNYQKKCSDFLEKYFERYINLITDIYIICAVKMYIL